MRYWHHISRWECVKGGLYADRSKNGMDADDSKLAYADFLGDIPRFQRGLDRVVHEWPISCEQFLSNTAINRIAWLGQAAMCIENGVPCKFRSGFSLLTTDQQDAANATARETLERWLSRKKPVQLLLPDPPKPIRGIHSKVAWHQSYWEVRGYVDLPDMVPAEVSRKQYAPSWESIAIAILSNDVALQSIGFSGPYSQYYSFFKQIELSERG